jgi:hypothetical protein
MGKNGVHQVAQEHRCDPIPIHSSGHGTAIFWMGVVRTGKILCILLLVLILDLLSYNKIVRLKKLWLKNEPNIKTFKKMQTP